MASLRDIRQRISSVKNTQQVTRAMKMVAAAKLRRAQERIFRTRPYSYQIGKIISHLRGHVDPTAHPLFQARDEVKAVLLVVVTADRGLAGGFNSNIIKRTEEEIRSRYQEYQDRDRLFLICVGRKGHDHFSKRGYEVLGDFRGAFDHLTFQTAQTVAGILAEGYLDGRWDDVRLIYNEFRNTISQNRIVEPLLPIPAEQFQTPVMAATLDTDEEEADHPIDYIFEPGPTAILETLVPRFLNYEVWRALLESNAAEQGARMVAMDSATSNADELLRDLRLKYNRARQDAITKELIEITSGADALASS